MDELGVMLPLGSAEPLPVAESRGEAAIDTAVRVGMQSCKKFWEAGDYEGAPSGDWDLLFW